MTVARTPREFFGPEYEEAICFEDQYGIPPSISDCYGGNLYFSDGYFWLKDKYGIFNPRYLVDATPNVGSLRTLGVGNQQACAGNDFRLLGMASVFPDRSMPITSSKAINGSGVESDQLSIGLYEIWANIDVHFRQGATGEAATITDRLLMAGEVCYVFVSNANTFGYIQFITDGGTGRYWIDTVPIISSKQISTSSVESDQLAIGLYELWADIDCHYRQGTTGSVATAVDRFLPAGQILPFFVSDTTTKGYIQIIANGLGRYWIKLLGPTPSSCSWIQVAS